ncbi:MAG: hypothetical protein OER95_17115 [Acidimicrobiia bacterium]|nr:hypothetical protein [Acidimicrobiia bacterium]
MPTTRAVVHYGLCGLAYSSYVLQGLEELADEGEIELIIKRSVPADLQAVTAGHPHMQMTPLFEATEGSTRVRFCVDNHDKADFIHPGLIANIDHYFKLNHDPEQLDQLDLTVAERAKIKPFRGPISPVGLSPIRHRPALKVVPAVAWGARDIVRRYRQLRKLLPLTDITALRSEAKSHDVNFVNRIYREPHHKPINDFRYEVGHRLATHPDINAKVGFIGPGVTGKFERYAVEETAPRDHLQQLAASRVGIYVWGTHRCLSFKLCELLALGLPVVGQTIPQDRNNLATLPNLSEQFAFDDPQELVDAVAKALTDEARLVELARSNIELFDHTLAPRPSARRIINTVFGEASSGSLPRPNSEEHHS